MPKGKKTAKAKPKKKQTRKSRYNRATIFKEWINGPWPSLAAFIDYCELGGDAYPSKDTIYKWSAKERWEDAKKERYAQLMGKVIEAPMRKAEQAVMNKYFQLKGRLLHGEISAIELMNQILGRIAGGEDAPRGTHVHFNYSDIANDIKRDLQQTTKEEQTQGNNFSMQQINAGTELDSLRRMVEETTPEQLERLEKIKALESGVKTVDATATVTAEEETVWEDEGDE